MRDTVLQGGQKFSLVSHNALIGLYVRLMQLYNNKKPKYVAIMAFVNAAISYQSIEFFQH